MHGLDLRDQGFRPKGEALGFRVYRLGFRVYRLGFRVYRLGFRVEGFKAAGNLRFRPVGLEQKV